MSVLKPIAYGWSFTQLGGGQGTKEGEWLSVSQFPTTVHVELLKHKRIPDPVCQPGMDVFTTHLTVSQFIGLHEWDVQCKL